MGKKEFKDRGRERKIKKKTVGQGENGGKDRLGKMERKDKQMY